MYADSGSEYILNYLGYPIGGDALVYAVGVDFDYKEKTKAKISFQHITKGETDFNATYPPEDSSVTSPTGIPETTMILSFTGSYTFKKPSFSIYSNLSFLLIENKNHIISTKVKDFQFTIGFNYTL